jgi:hypothetical protein
MLARGTGPLLLKSSKVKYLRENPVARLEKKLTATFQLAFKNFPATKEKS